MTQLKQVKRSERGEKSGIETIRAESMDGPNLEITVARVPMAGLHFIRSVEAIESRFRDVDAPDVIQHISPLRIDFFCRS